jgi:hypothetical protein
MYHVLNRAKGRLRLFKKEGDFLAFERVLLLAHRERRSASSTVRHALAGKGWRTDRLHAMADAAN